MFKLFFWIGPPQQCWGGPIKKKNYLNILEGTSKKTPCTFLCPNKFSSKNSNADK